MACRSCVDGGCSGERLCCPCSVSCVCCCSCSLGVVCVVGCSGLLVLSADELCVGACEVACCCECSCLYLAMKLDWYCCCASCVWGPHLRGRSCCGGCGVARCCVVGIRCCCAGSCNRGVFVEVVFGLTLHLLGIHPCLAGASSVLAALAAV